MKPPPFRLRLARRIAGRFAEQLATVGVRVDDSPGWTSLSAAPHDRDAAEIQRLYADALTAWRKNPLAKRIIDLTTGFTVGDGFELDSQTPTIRRFLDRWWHHPKNNLDLTLPDLSDELARAGDLFLSLHRNPHDGMSYLRLTPKDRIQRIETAANDWGTELAYYETQELGEPRRWLSPVHPQAPDSPAVMLHYAVNRPAGALLGESDLAPLIPWLLRYSRMLEDRVRLNWAVRAFLWVVNVPTNRIAAKREQYSSPPEAGSIIIKDEAEQWEPIAPSLQAADARYDLQAIRRMIQAASYPPHWMNEPEDVNLAVARAMTDPTTRNLRRRQLYLRHMVRDVAYHACRRAHEIGLLRSRPEPGAIGVHLPDISREDNESLAAAARELALAFRQVHEITTADRRLPSLARLALRQVAQFAGAPLTEAQVEAILSEADEADPSP